MTARKPAPKRDALAALLAHCAAFPRDPDNAYASSWMPKARRLVRKLLVERADLAGVSLMRDEGITGLRRAILTRPARKGARP